MAGLTGRKYCFRHTSIAHRQLLPKQNPFSTGITEDHESRIFKASIHIDWDCQVMHPYSELIHPARNEGKMSPEETTGLLPHSAYSQKLLHMPLWGLLAKPQLASITLTIATLWPLKVVDVLEKS